MKRTSILMMLLAGAFVVATSHPAHAGIVVGQCIAGTHYSTIQSAVDAAPSGAIIKVCPGGYPEQVTIEKPLTLEGFINGGDEGAFILPPTSGYTYNLGSATQIQVLNTDGVTISNLIVEGNSICSNSTNGILFFNASGTVSKVAVRNQTGTDTLCEGIGLVVSDFTNQPQTVTVQGSDFRNQQGFGIHAVGAGLTMNTLNNFISGSEMGALTVGIDYGTEVTGTIQGNTVIDQVYSQAAFGNPFGEAVGIQVYCSTATISGNVVANTQLGISVGCLNAGMGGNSIITGNKIFKTRLGDGIYIYSSGNKITSNTIVASAEAGIHFDATNAPAGGNTASGNTITEACAGILTTGTATNALSLNGFNVVELPTFTGPNCGPLFQ